MEAPATVSARILARKAGLKYVRDGGKGIVRRNRGKKVLYLDERGRPLRSAGQLRRIQALVIPPAWREVWICPSAQGHLQAVGRDARGRKQYLYHAEWNRIRDESKYGRMVAFARFLPRLRRRVARDLKKRGLPREKVLATVVRLLEMTLIRVGNDEYARDNHSFGLTTLRDSHVKVRGEKMLFSFMGKSGKKHQINLFDSDLAAIVKKCRDLPGSELFQYRDEKGRVVDVTSQDVNEYLRLAGGAGFSAKDFRTWGGTVLAARALKEFEAFRSRTEAKRNVTAAIKAVAGMLGNTPSICRDSYIHPYIFECYGDGSLVRRLEKAGGGKIRRLRPEEMEVLALLGKRGRSSKS